ncbi:MAG: hypothetical protein R8G34_05795 [Paracoccaceae bacterium]|nr:hypothetical protein [Paracoccaceae bacterium]
MTIFASSASAQQKVYEGEEAAALRCANTMAFTAVALESTGRIGATEKQVMLDITVRILVEHVSGTWAQKKAALAIVRDRRDLFQTFEDFERFANQCLRQFPIN